MTEGREAKLGRISWFDYTVDDAPGIREFYMDVAGWESGELDMGGYSDYFMTDRQSGEAIAGVCHARGVNADLPPVWMIYVGVDNLEVSLERCRALGGECITGPKPFGDGSYAVIRDPVGCILGLYEPPPDAEAS